MSAILTATKPSLRAVVLDALNDAYWSRRANVEECRTCARNPAGIALCHEEDARLAFEYEEARKRIESAPGDPEVMNVFAGNLMAALSGEETGEQQ
jgi:hypothetical protein